MQKILVLILFFVSINLAQEAPAVKYFPSYQYMGWDVDMTGDVSHYMIFYIQATDTNLINNAGFVDGADYEDIWEWWIGTSLYNYFMFKYKRLDNQLSWVKVGYMPVMYSGDKGLLRTSRWVRLRQKEVPGPIYLD